MTVAPERTYAISDGVGSQSIHATVAPSVWSAPTPIRTDDGPRPGDLVLAHGKGLLARLIRIGEAFDATKAARQWNHAAIVSSVSADGTVTVVQMSRRCVEIPLSDVAPGGYTQIRRCPPSVNARLAVAYARAQLGTKYGVLSLLSIAFNLLTPRFLRIDFRRERTLICSALVARSWEHGNFYCPVDPFAVSPAQLAEYVP